MWSRPGSGAATRGTSERSSRLASIAGPLLGGWFVDNLTWRWVFYINLPLGLVALFVTGTVLNIPFHRQDHRIDYPGAGLLVGGVSALLLVTVWGGREYEWGSPLIIGLAMVGLVLVGLFLWWETRTEEPILPLRLFRDRTFALTSGAGFVVGLAMFGGIIFLPLFLQIVVGASATNSGLLLLPMMAGIISRLGRQWPAHQPNGPLQDLPGHRDVAGDRGPVPAFDDGRRHHPARLLRSTCSSSEPASVS